MPVSFTTTEGRYLRAQQLVRVATITKDGKPHVTPVLAAFDKKTSAFYFAIDYGAKKEQNLRHNPSIALVVDTYPPSTGIMVQGKAAFIEHGAAFREAYKILKRIDYYKKNPFAEGEAPIIKVIPEKKVVWGQFTSK